MSTSVFFSPWKAFLGFFSIFSRAKTFFHAHFLAIFWPFSRPLLFFTGTFFGFFHGEQMSFHGQKLCFYTESFIVLTGIFCIFFHGHHFDFHGHTFRKIFTGSFLFSRALFEGFSGFFTGIFFSRAQFSIFFTGWICFFTGKKKHCWGLTGGKTSNSTKTPGFNQYQHRFSSSYLQKHVNTAISRPTFTEYRQQKIKKYERVSSETVIRSFLGQILAMNHEYQ